MNDTVDDEQITDKPLIPYAPPEWMAFHWGTFMTNTMPYLRRPEDVGIYLTMMGLAWLRGDATIPGDMAELKDLLQYHIRELHGHTFNRVVPSLLDRFFERREDGRFIHRGVENELKVSRKLLANRKQPRSKSEQNETTSNKINDLQAPILQTDRHTNIKKEGNLNGGRERKVNGGSFKPLAQPHLNGSPSLNDVPCGDGSATSGTTRNGLSYEEAMSLHSGPPRSRFDRH